MILRIALVLVGVGVIAVVSRALRVTTRRQPPGMVIPTGSGERPTRISAYLRDMGLQGGRQSWSSESPPLLLFTSTFCARCTGVRQMLASEHRCFVEIDVAEHPELARALGVRRVPTLFAMGADGTLHGVDVSDLRSPV